MGKRSTYACTVRRMSVMARCAATPRICDKPNPVTAWTNVAAPAAASGCAGAARHGALARRAARHTTTRPSRAVLADVSSATVKIGSERHVAAYAHGAAERSVVIVTIARRRSHERAGEAVVGL